MSTGFNAANISLQLLRGHFISQAPLGNAGMSLNDFVLGKPVMRDGRDMMQDALTGLIRSDAGMLRQAAKNMDEGRSIFKEAQTAVTGIRNNLKDMKALVEKVIANPDASKAAAKNDYTRLADGIKNLVAGNSYNGMSLMDKDAWSKAAESGDTRVGLEPSAAGDTGNLVLQAGKVQTKLALRDLSTLKTAFSATDLDDPEAALNSLDAHMDYMKLLEESYAARAGAFSTESAGFKAQADILDEAARRADAHNPVCKTTDGQTREEVKDNLREGLKDIVFDLMLRHQGRLVDAKS